MAIKKRYKKDNNLFGCMQGSIKIMGDIVAPTHVKWEANSGSPNSTCRCYCHKQKSRHNGPSR